MYMSSSSSYSGHADSSDFFDSLTLSLSLSLSLIIRPYNPLLLIDPPNYTKCPHGAVIKKFLRVIQHWHVYELRSTEERC